MWSKLEGTEIIVQRIYSADGKETYKRYGSDIEGDIPSSETTCLRVTWRFIVGVFRYQIESSRHLLCLQ